MAKVDPQWSLNALLKHYDPHSSWRPSFTEAYSKAIESSDPSERLDGWRTAAYIFGDMHVPVFCLFVCHHGQTLEPPGVKKFLGHIDLCLWEIGLAIPTNPNAVSGTVPSSDLGKPEGFVRRTESLREWLSEQLLPFDGDVGRAAVFAMRLTAARFGLISGPPQPTIAEVLDESPWNRPAKKRSWRFW